jgi:hypothetical protein
VHAHIARIDQHMLFQRDPALLMPSVPQSELSARKGGGPHCEVSGDGERDAMRLGPAGAGPSRRDALRGGCDRTRRGRSRCTEGRGRRCRACPRGSASSGGTPRRAAGRRVASPAHAPPGQRIRHLAARGQARLDMFSITPSGGCQASRPSAPLFVTPHAASF